MKRPTSRRHGPPLNPSLACELRRADLAELGRQLVELARNGELQTLQADAVRAAIEQLSDEGAIDGRR